ncbi:hypothetical protein ID866_4347 [Astraeus odoratus]|nr:hypothetical protein ID866_4347 [Astraeus odoratus]
MHLQQHGYVYKGNAMVQCPWPGCTKQLQYMSVPRHIRSAHLGVRYRCKRCGTMLTRREGLTRHMKTCAQVKLGCGEMYS